MSPTGATDVCDSGQCPADPAMWRAQGGPKMWQWFFHRKFNTAKIRVYQTLVLPVLLYACETCTVLFADTNRLEAFHMKCQRQIMKIRWQDHTRNTEVALLTGLCPVLDLVTRRRNAVFGHIARLSEDTPAHQALRCHVDLSLGRLPDQGWRCRPGRPSNRWIDQVRGATNTPPADLWRRSITRGHSGATLRSLLTTH